LLAGSPSDGKGPLAAYLGACVALGKPAFGELAVRQMNVGILDFEGASLTRRRLRAHVRGLGATPEDLAGKLFLRDVEPGAVDVEWIQRWCAARDVGFLVVDSYMSAMSTYDVDPNSPDYACLARELGALNLCVLIVAHARKPMVNKRNERPALGDVAGSYALGGMAATGISVFRPNEDDPGLIRVACMRAPDEPFATFGVRWVRSPDGSCWTATTEGLAKPGERAGEIHAAALDLAVGRTEDLLRAVHPDGLTATSVRKALSLSGARTADVLAAALARRVAVRSPTVDKRGDVMHMWLPPEHRYEDADAAPPAGASAKAGGVMRRFKRRAT
jgi:hypothetical protein